MAPHAIGTGGVITVMRSRRLLAAPLVAFCATALVAAVIDSGQRTRAEAHRPPLTTAADPANAAEAARIDAAMQSEHRCSGPDGCDPTRTGARVRRAAEDISLWPADRRYQLVRMTLENQLLARANVLDQRFMADHDGHTSRAEATRLGELRTAWLKASREALDAQRSAGIIDDAAYRQAISDLVHEDEP